VLWNPSWKKLPKSPKLPKIAKIEEANIPLIITDNTDKEK